MSRMQWLKAEQIGQKLHLQVWLDTSKTQSKSTNPDPIYVKQYHFPSQPPNGWSGGKLNGTAYTDWQSYVLAEAQLLAKADYDALHPATTPLSVEGELFTPA